MTTPRPLVAALIVQEGKLLMVHNIKKGLRIEPTGGKIHDGETPAQAAIREAKEELDIDIEVMEELEVVLIHTPEGDFENHQLLCRIVSGTPAIPPEEAHKLGGFGWYTFDEIRRMPEVVPEVPKILDLLATKM